MIRVENRRTYHGPGYYVGRPSPLGNPYRVGKKYDHERDPDGVLEAYRVWLREQVAKPGRARTMFLAILAHARDGGDSAPVLICWCAPKRCHADVIREEIEKVIGGAS